MADWHPARLSPAAGGRAVSYEALTPVQIESKLRALVTELTKAQRMLSEARDVEVEAEVALMRARDEVAKAAPRVTRGEFTVAEREEFIATVTRDEWEVLHRAEARRKNAEDYLRIVRDQASVVQSLSRSVAVAYGLAGVAA